MDFFDLLFGGGEAIQSIFQLGFIPKEEDFREFSSVEYQQFNEKECDICGKMYTFNYLRPFHHELLLFLAEGINIIS